MSRTVLCRLLARPGHSVLEAADAQTALHCLSSTRVDIIVSDVQMPGLNGIELTRVLRHDPRTARTPVLVCSSCAERDVVLEAAGLHVAGYLLKPITAEKLSAKLAEIIARLPPALEDQESVKNRLGLTQLGYRRLLHVMMTEGRELIDGIVRAVKREDRKDFEFLTHRLASAARQIGAYALEQAVADAAASIPVLDHMGQLKHLMNIESEFSRIGELTRESSSLKYIFGSGRRAAMAS